jgi:hypothetical protein
MKNTADLIGGKPIAVLLSISGVSAINPLVIYNVLNPPRGPSAGWWVLTTANAAGTNGLTCLPKHGGSRDNKFWSPIL